MWGGVQRDQEECAAVMLQGMFFEEGWLWETLCGPRSGLGTIRCKADEIVVPSTTFSQYLQGTFPQYVTNHPSEMRGDWPVHDLLGRLNQTALHKCCQLRLNNVSCAQHHHSTPLEQPQTAILSVLVAWASAQQCEGAVEWGSERHLMVKETHTTVPPYLTGFNWEFDTEFGGW